MTRRRVAAVTLLVVAVAVVVFRVVVRPSNDRNWAPNEAVLPAAEFAGARVTLRNVRNTTYRSPDDYTPAYYDTTLNLDSIRRVWFVEVPFSGSDALAHTFLSFEFAGPRFVAISVEARKERGEQYGAFRGLLRRYELMYVIADERDAIGLRTTYRRDAVYLYPMRAEPERVRQLFVSMLTRANELRERPEFYNTLTANCTSTIVRHVNSLVAGRVPFSYRWLLPGYADRLAFDLGLIDTDLPVDSIRPHFGVTAVAQAQQNSAEFSIGIRKAFPSTVRRVP